MNSFAHPAFTIPVSQGIQLQQLVNKLVGNSLLIATAKCSAVINEVGGGVILQNANPKVVALIGDIIHTVIINSKEGDIHIDAKQNEGNTVLKVQERNNYNGYALSYSLGTLMSDVNVAGADLAITGEKQKVTTIIFTFPDKQVA